ncbi:leucine-rich repeat domain-containing protein, partial [Catenulispora rubra]|uniref:leucine-rich repeat domain-containing protein n=1 Tax=Catenulispora rubra TaxID=280293 RepID=UPI001891FA06
MADTKDTADTGGTPNSGDGALEARLRTELAAHTTQERLSLAALGLTAVPDQIRTLSSLRELDLSRNQLDELPEWIGELSSLESLDVSGNQLTEVPESLAGVHTLRRIELGGNRLIDVPAALGELPLEHIGLDDNPHLLVPPPHIVTEGTAAVLAYLCADSPAGEAPALDGASLGGAGFGGTGSEVTPPETEPALADDLFDGLAFTEPEEPRPERPARPERPERVGPSAFQRLPAFPAVPAAFRPGRRVTAIGGAVALLGASVLVVAVNNQGSAATAHAETPGPRITATSSQSADPFDPFSAADAPDGSLAT